MEASTPKDFFEKVLPSRFDPNKAEGFEATIQMKITGQNGGDWIVTVKDKKIDIRVGRFPFVGNGKAIALGEDQGLVKVIFDKKTGQLLGAHMVGAEVTELIQGYVVAMNLETTEEELMHTIFPHPTLSEMMKEAVLDAYGRVLNM